MTESLVEWWRAAVGLAEAAPPLELCAAMTLLPLVGIPVSPFWVASGIRFGVPLGTLAASISLALNMAMGYWVARGALRLPISRWLARRGHVVPRRYLSAQNRLIVMVRVAPPLPLFVQNLLLGLAGVGFWRYMALSLPIQAGYAFGFVWFGDALTEQDAWRIVLGVAVLTSVILGMSIVRSALQARFGDDSGSTHA